ncbi:AB hydrolase superfamily protein YfhM-like isoform X4 [Dermacentor albipictus]|uniref:AB hydrolase superfamily protein YfhM-like isoform X4 n=1 Tax=Dermacentor albipictus TaxID=60249 RepID=UPI0038FC60D0
MRSKYTSPKSNVYSCLLTVIVFVVTLGLRNILPQGTDSAKSITVHYVSKGCDNKEDNSSILLLLHGFLDFWYIWNRQIPTLGEEFCVVAPDLRGYGLSTKPVDPEEYVMTFLINDVKDLLGVINPNHTRKVVLVGHGWGGMISFCFATMYETLIDKMIIINGMHPKAFSKQLLRSLKQMRMSWYLMSFRHPVVPEQYLELRDFAFFDQVHRGFTKDEEYAHKYMFSRKGALTGALNYYRAVNESEGLHKLQYRKINVTTLILWGQKDAFLTHPIARFNREWLTTSYVLYYRKAGHWLQRECSEQVAARIEEFVLDEKYELLTNETSAEQSVDTCSESLTPDESRTGTICPLLPAYASVPDFNLE